MKKFLEIIKNKWLIRGTTTVLLVAIIIAIYLLLNWGVSKLNLEDIDCTEKKLYSLSDETRQKLKDIDKDVTIQLINMTDNTYVTEYVKKYEKACDKIKVEEIPDLTARVDLMTKYGMKDSDSLIVVKTDEKETKMTEDDLYTFDYTNYQEIDTTEESITNAIVEVIINEKPKVYVLSGKSYYTTDQMLETVLTQLKGDSNEVDYTDILVSGKIPDDCKCLVITTLSKDLTEIERDQIIEYIKKGGKLMLLTSQNIIDEETPNFNEVLAQYGVQLKHGVVFEQDTSNMLQGNPDYIISNATASFMSNIDMNMKVCLPDAGSIEFEESEKLEELGVEYEVLATTSEKSFLRTNLNLTSAKKTEQDGNDQSYILGALATKKISDDVKSEMIIFSSEIFASDAQTAAGLRVVDLYNNKDVIINSISHLTERTDTITIRKTGEEEPYTVTVQQHTIISTIIFIIPLIIIIAGVIVWVIRKRKK